MLTEYLNQAQATGLVGLGVIFWATGVLQIRYGSHIIFANDFRRICTYIGTIPLTYITIRLSETLLSISPKARVTSLAIMTSAALMLDGIAIMWYPTLYENPSLRKKNSAWSVAFSRMGAAWLLWFVSTSFAVALLT